MNTGISALLFAMAGLLTSCSTSPRQVWTGAPPQVRDRLGTVGVWVDHSQSREFTFDMPDSKKEATRDMAGLGISANLTGAANADQAGGFVLALLPAFAVGGAIYGAVAGVSAPKLQRALMAMTNATSDCDLIAHLPDRLIADAQARGFKVVDANADEPKWNTLLTARVVTQQLARAGNESPDPALLLHFVVEVRLTDTNRNTLYATYLERRSKRLDFVQWAADGALQMRHETTRLQNEMAAAIISRVFLGEDSE